MKCKKDTAILIWTKIAFEISTGFHIYYVSLYERTAIFAICPYVCIKHYSLFLGFRYMGNKTNILIHSFGLHTSSYPHELFRFIKTMALDVALNILKCSLFQYIYERDSMSNPLHTQKNNHHTLFHSFTTFHHTQSVYSHHINHHSPCYSDIQVIVFILPPKKVTFRQFSEPYVYIYINIYIFIPSALDIRYVGKWYLR